MADDHQVTNKKGKALVHDDKEPQTKLSPNFSPNVAWPVVLDNVDFPDSTGHTPIAMYTASTTDAAWNSVITNQLLTFPNIIAVFYKTSGTGPYIAVKNWANCSPFSSNTNAMSFILPQFRQVSLNSTTTGNLVHVGTGLFVIRRANGLPDGTLMEVNSSNASNGYQMNAGGTLQSNVTSTKYVAISSGTVILSTTGSIFDYDLFVATGFLRDTDSGQFIISLAYPITSGTALITGTAPLLNDMFQFRS